MKQKLNHWVIVVLVILSGVRALYSDWPMLAANPQRTSWVSDEVRGALSTQWYKVIDPYIDWKVQTIIANGKIFMSSSRGLYCFNAADGSQSWPPYATDFPLGHSPTIVGNTAYVGCMDRRVHAVDINTGQKLSTWNFYEGYADSPQAGFETNPLVVDAGQGLRVYIGCRDGYFYCFDAVSGALKWRFKTYGMICYSPAYKNNVFYFASDDSYAYAIRDNGAAASTVWTNSKGEGRSEKLPGNGFHSYWPVVYHDKQRNHDYVLLSGSVKSINWFGLGGTWEMHCHGETWDAYGSMPWGTFCGPTGTEPGDWATGTLTIDTSLWTEYRENRPGRRPWRRHLFVLDASTGVEFTFDSDNDGYAEYAPMNWSGADGNGNKYPPVVVGDGITAGDGVIYTIFGYKAGGNGAAQNEVCGWKFGTKYMSLTGHWDSGQSDEPKALTAAGNIVYWAEGFNAVNNGATYGSVEISKPLGSNDCQPYFLNYNVTAKYSNFSLYGTYGGNGSYSSFDGRTLKSLIPYNGRLYMVSENNLIALSQSGGAASLPTATKQASAITPPPSPSSAYVKQLLETEVQKIVSAGHLRIGYFDATQWSCSTMYGYDTLTPGDHLSEMYHTAFDTINPLIKALPHLSPALQLQTSAYIKNEFNCVGWWDGHKAYEAANIGWKNGAQREVYDDLPQMTLEASKNYDEGNSNTASIPRTYIWQYHVVVDMGTYPQDLFYGAWQYCKLFPSEAKATFDNMKTNLHPITTISTANFITYPYLLNQFIVGYRGYMELERLAGYTTNITQSTKYADYTTLLNLRLTNFSKDSPFNNEHNNPNVNLNIARNFMYLMPELADELRASKLAQVQAAIDEYHEIEPYWFVSRYDHSAGESTFDPPYTLNAMFQAKALILKQSYDELVKYIDVPQYEKGDMFYILNLVSALDAAPSTPAISVVSPNGGEVWNTGSQATVSWVSSNITGNVNIDITTDGSAWTSLAANTANVGTKAVTMPSVQSTTCKVRVQSVSGTPSDTSDGNFTLSVPVPSITVISPNGGESWQTGTTQTVTWTSANISGNVDIEVSLSGINGPWVALKSATANDGTEAVTAPSTVSTTCRIRVKSVSGAPSDYSNSDFTLTATPQPIVSVNPSSIDFGSITQGQSGTNTFNITNTGAGTLSGTLTANQPWLTATPATFSGNSAAVTVSVNTTGLPAGANTGTVTVTTNGGIAAVSITVNVTITPGQNPHIALSTTSLNFGELELGSVSQPQAFNIKNDGQGTLTGTISVSDSWITIDKTSLNLAAQAEEQVTVSVDNSLLAQKEGPAKGEITITSNGNNGAQVTTTIAVEFTATCVLVKPNPVKAGQPVTFYGDGIVPGQTKIIIYTLSGTVVAAISAGGGSASGMISAPDNVTTPMNGQLQNEITWQTGNLSPGIYIYVYESPKEKGIGKFTVVAK